jgi:hypothetical protein
VIQTRRRLAKDGSREAPASRAGTIEMMSIEMVAANIAASTRAMLLPPPRAVDTRLPREAVGGCRSSMQLPIWSPR